MAGGKFPDLSKWDISPGAGDGPSEPPSGSRDSGADTPMVLPIIPPQKISAKNSPLDPNQPPKPPSPPPRSDEPEIIGSKIGLSPKQLSAQRAKIRAQQRLDRRAAERSATAEARIAEKAQLASEAITLKAREREAIATARAAAQAQLDADRATRAQEFHQSLVDKATAREALETKRATRDQAQRVQDLIALAGGPLRLLQQIRAEKARRSLYEFVRQAWSYIDSAPFLDSWAVMALCQHLEAVTRGDIRFFLANYPPRCAKTLVTSVCWPVWTWLQDSNGYTSGPQVRFLGASYGQDLSLKGSSKMRELINTPWFQENWGELIKIKEGSDTKSAFANTAGGDRQATSITGKLLGFGGDIVVVDDPHNTEDVESDQQREGVLQGWREISTTRLNDPKKSALVVIMQRLNEADVSGEIMENKSDRAWVHLMIPMRHELGRHCITYLPSDDRRFWEDPRTEEGQLMWPERFGPKEVSDLEEGLGPYMASGRLQQSPTPKGGGIIKREWWEPWPPAGQEHLWTHDLPDSTGIVASRVTYPDFDFICASLDCAATEKEENDFSACTVWGTFTNNRGQPKIMLISAWRGHYAIHDLVNRVMKTAARKGLECDTVLVENKSSGHALAQELKRLMRPGAFTLKLYDPKRDGGGDKVSRVYAVQPAFAAGLIHAPDTVWSEAVIREMELFPKGRNDDWVDCCSMAINWLRKRGLAQMPFEHEENIRPKMWQGQREALYDI